MSNPQIGPSSASRLIAKIKRYFTYEYSFEKSKLAWQNIPIDDLGYLDSKDLLELPDDEFLRIMRMAAANRYDRGKYRNFEDKWRKYSGISSVSSKVILDFGCGAGIEALEFARKNKVIIADINPLNLQVANRLLGLHGFQPHEIVQINHSEPFFELKTKAIDIFYANGVLHHTPKIREILEFVIPKLSENGIARLMLYSDRGFLKYINSDLPDYREDIINSTHFKKMYKHFDTVGNYADWYSKEKIEYKLIGLYDVGEFNYITDDDRFCFVDLFPNCK